MAGLILLVACSSGHGKRVTARPAATSLHTVPPVSAIITTTSEPAAPAGLVFQDEQGFRYRVVVSGVEVGPETTGGTPAPPGQVYLTLRLILDNLQTDRAAPVPKGNIDYYIEVPQTAVTDCFRLPRDLREGFGVHPKWQQFVDAGYQTSEGHCLLDSQQLFGHLATQDYINPDGFVDGARVYFGPLQAGLDSSQVRVLWLTNESHDLYHPKPKLQEVPRQKSYRP